MRKILLLLVCVFFTQLAYTQKQTNVSKYKSENHYGNGVIEYIHIHSSSNCHDMENLKIYYFTSKNPQKILLEVKQMTIDCIPFSECLTYYKVNFPNQTKTYKLNQGVMHLSCEDNGKLQPYEFIME